MKKMSFEALQSRAESVMSNELLSSISGGTENDCHDNYDFPQDDPKNAGKPRPIIVT